MPKRGNLIRASDEFTRPANTTAYAAGDIVGPATLTITAASNASPIVITGTAHGLATGDRVTVAAVGGNTAANADWVITRVDANTFSLDGSIGNSAYTSGGTAIRTLRLGFSASGGGLVGKIIRTRLICNSSTITNGTFRVYFHRSQIAAIADNAAWTLLYANRAAMIGISANLVLATEGSGSDSGYAQDVASIIPFTLASNVQNVFSVIVAEAAYTPTSAETFYLEVTVDQY